MRSDGGIQFQPVPEPPAAVPPEASPPPDWLQDFFDWMGDLFSPLGNFVAFNWSWLSWVLIALAVGLVLYAIWRAIDPATLTFKSRKSVAEPELQVDQGKALQLLDDADRLAAEGRFDEATHLLLQRSVGQIAELRPDLIDPSSTAREIAALPALPDRARQAFGTIAGRVEASLFALRRLTMDDWQAARTAYADFALGYRGETA
jgi:hypothetical protein